MNYYIEISVKDDGKYKFAQLWSDLYMQIHLAFVSKKDENGKVPYGVSFPEYSCRPIGSQYLSCLGNKMRIFSASKEQLEGLDLMSWLSRQKEHLAVSAVMEVPEEHYFINVKRYRAPANVEKLARRQAKRKGISFDEAMALYKVQEKPLALPYVKIKSLSGGSFFSLFFNQSHQEREAKGLFSCYGLDERSTVPHW